MKIRNGFVSNSSSSSFVIDAEKYSVEKIENYIESLLKAKAILEGEERDMEDVCFVYNQSFEEFKESFDKSGYSGYYDMIPKHKNLVIVDSTRDNSIPWDIQEALESIAIKRYHWG